MQNDPHCACFPFAAPLGAHEEAFQRAHAHARATAPHASAGGPQATPISRTDPPDDPETAVDAAIEEEPLLDGEDLLRAAREPIEWLLTLAHRLAANDPEEIAAIDRLRAAFHARIAGRAIGVRMSDVLVAFALLVGALDHRIVLEGVTRTIADGVATLLTYEGVALAAQLARVADRLSVTTLHPPRSPRPRRRTARPTPL